MGKSNRSRLLAILQARRIAIAASWYRAVARTGFSPLGAAELRGRFEEMTERIIDLLVAATFERREARAIGASLAKLHLLAPETVSRTQEVLARELDRDLGANQETLLQERLVPLLSEVVAGYFERARDTVLAEQENVRAALLKERDRAYQALRRSEASLAEAQRVARLGHWEHDLDKNELRWSDEIFRIFELDKRGFGATLEAFRERVHPDDVELVDEVGGRAAIEGKATSFEHRIVRPGGEVRFVHQRVEPLLGDDGRPSRLLGTVQDVTERKRAQELLRQQSAAMTASMDGMALLDGSGTFVYVNDAHARIYGYNAAEDLLGTGWAALYDEEQLERFERETMRALGEEGHWRGEAIGRRRDGSTFPQEVSISSVEGGGFVCIVRDVTERKALEAELEYQAFHDSLTGLPNRALFMDRLDHALARARRDSSAIAVLFMDLDDFKVVNDSLGHDAGDALLVEVAERLGGCLRPEDTAARLGGDEFAVLLEKLTDEGEAIRVADRIGNALKLPFSLGPDDTQEAHVNGSIGVALGRSGQLGIANLLRNADVAMYRAKARGKARHAVFEEQMDEWASRRLEAENKLRKAIERGEIVAHYQPKLSLKSGAVLGMEALARWVDPGRGLVLPSEFISVAEETGLIVPLGESVLHEACRQALAWQEENPGLSPVVVWANLSPRQFHRADVVGQVSSVLRETGLDPHYLGLEITENAAIDDAESTVETLVRLKGLGVRIAIDDFGTGYSSLSYLKRFPVDALKIDRSFVNGICQYPEDLAIVQAVITLGRALGMEVVAEGVETHEQLDLLRGLGCDHAQGYHLARPMPAKEASAFLAAQVDPR